jgi:hypothetical protein
MKEARLNTGLFFFASLAFRDPAVAFSFATAACPPWFDRTRKSATA